jgi:hypothetical protein
LEGGGDATTMNLLARLTTASGRLEEARRLFDSPRFVAAAQSVPRRYFMALPTYLGYVDRDYPETVGVNEISQVGRLRSQLLFAIGDADADAIREVIERSRDYGRSVGAPIWEDLARAGEGFIRALDGDPVAGLAEVEDALGFMNTQTEQFWLRWFEWMVRYSETRGRAVSKLARPWPGDVVYDLPRLYVLGRALEAEGDARGAREAYATFAAALADADPGLAVWAKIDSANAAVARLGLIEQ